MNIQDLEKIDFLTSSIGNSIESNEDSHFPNESRENIGFGRGVYISTYGCQMNVNDTERLYSLLEMVDFVPVEKPEEATLIIINACSVREKPVHKVYSEVGRYRKLRKLNPSLKIGVGGCVGQQEKDTLIKKQPLIDFVFGTDNIDQIPQIVREVFQIPKKLIQAQFQHKAPYHIETLIRNPGVSTFINITKGCDNFCTFCVVPFTRGREKSRPLAHILTDIRQLILRGLKEVTLLGQNVNSYKGASLNNDDKIHDFADLLEKVARETEIQRIRFTTSHPKDFNEKLMNVMVLYKDKICEYVHLPFQSGSTSILERMNRGYTREEYIKKMGQMRSLIPGLVLSTDIIVGFPGETEKDFQDTMALLEEIPFETIFAFKYSPRPMTRAARFVEQVPEDIKDRRLQELLDRHRVQSFEFVKKYENQILDVLVEGPADTGLMQGRSRQNKLVYFPGNLNWIGRTVPVKIEHAYPHVFRGKVMEELCP